MKILSGANRFSGGLCAGVVLMTACLIEAYSLELAETIETGTFDYFIHYYNNDPSDTIWFTSDSDAQDIADHFDPASGTGIHQANIDAGFREPTFVWGNDIDLKPSDITNGRANALFPNRIVLPPEWLKLLGGHDSDETKKLCVHELHHMVQYEYIPWGLYFLSLYPFAVEGPASAAEDHLLSSLDDVRVSNKPNDFYAQATAYLQTQFPTNLWASNGYDSAIFWKYLMEQFGTVRSEPGVGNDVIQRFYELADENREGVSSTIQDLLDERDRHTTTAGDKRVALEEVFQDFTIANWVRRYRNPESYAAGFTITVDDPGRFFYEDENPSVATEPFLTGITKEENADPRPGSTHSLTAGANTGPLTASVEKWAAHYLRCDFTGSASSTHGLGFWAETESGGKIWYSLIGLRQSGEVDLIVKGATDPDAGNSFNYATMQSSTAGDPYVMFTAVLNGDEGGSQDGFTFTTVDTDYHFGYFEPEIDIVEPNETYRAYVGDGANPERFLVRLRVVSPDHLGPGSLQGLEADQFEVFVGGSSDAVNRGEVIAAAYVLGEYWLTVQAPDKMPTPVTALALIVKLGDVSDVEEAAVVYGYLEVDQMLVIDHSGSMNRTSGDVKRIDAARAAAQLFVDASGSDDQLGIVGFSGDNDEAGEIGINSFADAEVIYSLEQMNSQFERDLVNFLIDDSNPADPLRPSGKTSIGDGLYWGAKELVDKGKPDSEKWIVLLSDGHQNEPSTFDDQFPFLLGSGVHVEAIALGSGSDKNHLQSIATDTSGKYYEVEASEAATLQSSGNPAFGESTASSGNMILDLADTFLLSSERIHRRERIMERSGSLAAGETISFQLALAEGGLSNCVASLYASSTSANVEFTITTPGADVVPVPDSGYTSTDLDPSGNYWNPSYYTTYRLDGMEDGIWTLSISNEGAVTETYLLVLSGKNKQGVQVSLHFVQNHAQPEVYAEDGLFLRGLPMPISLVITDGQGPVRGADVVAEVTHPDRVPVILRLRDNGGGHDGAANDGVYSGVFAATTEADTSGGNYDEETPPDIKESYQVTVTATGQDNLQREFQRVEKGMFQLYEVEQGYGGDHDGDGMPSRYEKLHLGLMDGLNDASDDWDGDGLKNIEEYQLGTGPGSLDTDGGGENDKSEVDHGSNPLDYTDDAVNELLIARVLDRYSDVKPPNTETKYLLRANQNLITYSPERGHTGIELYRSTSSTGPFVHIDTIDVTADSGAYLDQGLINGTTYYYYMKPISGTDRQGVPTRIFSGTPRVDPIPPSGLLSINRGAIFTAGTEVQLLVYVSSDVTEMKLGLVHDLSSVPWIPYSELVSPFSIGPRTSGEEAEVHALVRDAAGNITRLRDSITYLPPLVAGVVNGTVHAPLDTSDGNIGVDLDGAEGSFRAWTGPTGEYTFTVLPGTYALTVAARGYEAVTLPAETVLAGETLTLPLLTLVPTDLDGDSLYDVHELRDHGTDRDLADTDSDGLTDGSEVNHSLTSPIDASSVLQFFEISDTVDGLTSITWDSVEGVVYEVSYRENSSEGPWVPLSTVTGVVGSATSLIDPLSDGAVRRLYRVTVPVP